MGGLYIFLNSRVENSGTLAGIGDKALAPFRYLFNGKTIRVQPGISDKEIEIHHVASFHERGSLCFSRTNGDLTSSSTGMIKAALSVVFLIPGLLIGAAFKGLSYLYSSARENYRLAKEHLTPINREIGSALSPIKTREELRDALEDEKRSDLKNRPTNALIIHGDGDLTINDDPGILGLNPMKLVLEGAIIVHQSSAMLPLGEYMNKTRKWEENNTSKSIDEALKARAPRRSWASCKRYHMLFNLARPQVV